MRKGRAKENVIINERFDDMSDSKHTDGTDFKGRSIFASMKRLFDRQILSTPNKTEFIWLNMDKTHERGMESIDYAFVPLFVWSEFSEQ